MSPKCLFAFLLLLVPTTVLLVHIVEGCVNFEAGYMTNMTDGNTYPLVANLLDNLQETDTPTCYADGAMLQRDSLYHFDCERSGYAATFDARGFLGVATYTRPGAATFSFLVPPGAAQHVWAACMYNCHGPDCFVPITAPA